MKIPFERNNYFWGKLLTAEDFQAEQQYFDEKRRFINRIIHGGGILCGLEAIRLDEKHILVQSGAALDYAGREVILASPLTINVSLLEGFSFDNISGFSYLCISFKECFRGDVASIENTGEKNRIYEDAFLYLTQIAPAYPSGPQSLDEALEDNFHIYLAKLHFIMGESSFIIEKAEDIRHKITGNISDMPATPDYLKAFKEIEAKIEKVLKEYVQLSQMRPVVSSGITVVDFGLQGKRGKVFYSPEITHGLGAGHVGISLGILDDGAGGENIYYGSPGIFDENFLVSAKVFISTGTFIIGVQITTNTTVTQARIYWTAFRDNAFKPHKRIEPFMSITPGVASVPRGERISFKLEGTGVSKEDIVWRVKEPDGGVILKNGEYHAPDMPGVYEIQAVAGKRTTTSFVVVK